jgi:hypothetical protein
METSIERYGHQKKNAQTNRESFGEMCFPVANSTNYANFWEKKERCLLGFTILSLGPKALGPWALAYVYDFGHRCFFKYITFNLAQECAMQG